ncbi:MAG: hypothetical protein L6W00_13665 [Lentisphaeria bacterium]|nr:MAG: hypothetical protein L6W00_13665 [Lentisphaeria bacterium]
MFFCCLLLSFSAVAGQSVEKKSIILSEGVAVRAPTVKLQLPKNAEIIRGKQKWRRILKLDVAPDNAANDHVARIAVDVPINSAVWGEILYRGEKIIPLKEKRAELSGNCISRMTPAARCCMSLPLSTVRSPGGMECLCGNIFPHKAGSAFTGIAKCIRLCRI